MLCDMATYSDYGGFAEFSATTINIRLLPQANFGDKEKKRAFGQSHSLCSDRNLHGCIKQFQLKVIR